MMEENKMEEEDYFLLRKSKLILRSSPFNQNKPFDLVIMVWPKIKYCIISYEYETGMADLSGLKQGKPRRDASYREL